MSRRGAAALALLLLTGACATNPDGTSPGLVGPAGPEADEGTSPEYRMGVQVVQTPNLGEILVDHRQNTLYRYEKDATNPPKSNCVEPGCVLQWTPLLTAEVETTSGIDAALLGMTERPNGLRQVTLNGHPLYRYVEDEKAGDAFGDGLDEVWFAVTPTGERARQ
ncbi:COG4315 family predicted lipoprotein [Lentzea sp. HUAS TT2]|uniref:COG4315 family predicted lipoprotein n=1 Tax=Lentzea sp. HUAS TT2 TaxID=3447454 RepID=UPI003F70EA5A